MVGPAGKFKPLHMLNPCRLDYIVDQIAAEFGRDPKTPRPFAGLRLLDIGCGGGLLAEPMARLGADVVGSTPPPATSPSPSCTRRSPSSRSTTATAPPRISPPPASASTSSSTWRSSSTSPTRPAFLAACRELLKPGGLMICSTINRNPKSWLMAIVGAEHVMRWLPVGTHDWRKFITPDELFALLRGAGLEPVDRKGFVFDPLDWSWRLSDRDLSVNYVTASVRRGDRRRLRNP